jgi:DNA-binding transcriptional ArsR family regulator
METSTAVGALSALAHEGRLEIFRLLVRAGADGVAGVLPNTLSSNLNILNAAGLVTSRREGRSIIYAAGYGRMRELLAFLMEDCCGGKPEICAPLVDIASRACDAEAGAC